ncbi:Small ligand-binding sensory domain FIST [Gammaproteobacteria bacterium]
MRRFSMGYAITERSTSVVTICRQIEPLPPGANLGFIYATDHYADELDLLVAELRGRTKVSNWVGTVGIGLSVGDKEYFDTPAIVVLVGAFPADGFRVFATTSRSMSPVVRTHGSWYRPRERHLAVVHGDPNSIHTPELLRALVGELPGGFAVGGIVSSRGSHTQIANSLVQGAVSGVIFNELVPVYTALTQGCIPIGPSRQVTDCERNLIRTLDGRPAIDVLREDIGELLARKLNRINGYIFTGLLIPNTNDYTVRNLIAIDRGQGWIAIGEWPRIGQSILFCRRDANQARENLEKILANLMRRVPRPPQAALYFSCFSRGERIFGIAGIEQRLIRSYLGDIPLIGFYANGEVSYNNIHGYAGVVTVFL